MSRKEKQMKNKIINKLILVMINYGEVRFTITSMKKINCKIKTLTNQNPNETMFI